MSSGIFVIIALVELAVIILLYMNRLGWKKEAKVEYLARRRAELRVDLTAVASLDKPVEPV